MLKKPYFADIVAMTDDTEVLLLSPPPPGTDNHGDDKPAGFWRVTSSEERAEQARKWSVDTCRASDPQSLADTECMNVWLVSCKLLGVSVRMRRALSSR